MENLTKLIETLTILGELLDEAIKAQDWEAVCALSITMKKVGELEKIAFAKVFS